MVLFQHFGLETMPIFKHFDLTDFNYPLHLHRAFEILYVRKGQLQIQIEDNTYHVNNRQFVIVFPNQIHGFDMSPNTTITIVLFSPEIVGAFNEQYQDSIPENPVIFDNDPLNFDHTSNIFGIKSLLYGMCNKVVEQASFVPRKTSASLNIVHTIIDYINNHYTKECTLKEIAEAIGYDYVYLSKLFQRVMGIPYTKYLNRFRISKARQMLKDTDNSITQIAYGVGYANLRTFNRNFKELNKISPAQYRSSSTSTRYEKSIKENYISG